MPKTEFAPYGTVVTSAFCRSIYGQGANDGHKHDGADEDGHCEKIKYDHIDETAQTKLKEMITKEVRENFFPIGTVLPYAGTNELDGWLVCDGKEVSSSDPQYSAYRDWVNSFAPYLNENGKYCVPDYKGRVLIGAGRHVDVNGDSRDFNLTDKDGGEYEHALTIEEMPSHTHRYGRRWGGGSIANGSSDAMRDLAETDTGGAGGDQPHNNIQPYAVVNFIIRVKP